MELVSQLKADQERSRAIGAELRPELYLTATFSGRNGGAPPSSGASTELGGWVPYIPNWDVGLVFSWPIYDGTVLARKAAAQAREEVRKEELASIKQEDFANVRRAYVQAEVARDALPSLERAVDAARANYAQADARFRAGLGTSVELADAEALRTDAEIQLAIGRFEQARARASLGRAIAEGN
jgi:outer membrane protein TolC